MVFHAEGYRPFSVTPRGKAVTVAVAADDGIRISHLSHGVIPMKKLQLDMDALAIESFATEKPAEERGTVAAYITQGANTCYHCTRYGCPLTELCM
jgi:hypothetical protein